MSFERKDTATVMDGMVVRYQREHPGGESEISASRNKVLVAGDLSIHSRSLLAETIETLCKAFVHYEHLQPNQAALFNRVEPLNEAEAARRGLELGQHLLSMLSRISQWEGGA